MKYPAHIAVTCVVRLPIISFFSFETESDTYSEDEDTRPSSRRSSQGRQVPLGSTSESEQDDGMYYVCFKFH